MNTFFDILFFIFQILFSLLSDVSFIASIIIFIVFIIEACILLAARKYRKFISDFEYDTKKTDTFIYVLIPCLNEELVIQNTLNSLLKTTCQQIKFIVIDDSSSDNTVQIVQSNSDNRLILVERVLPEAQVGKGAALNFALKNYVLPEINQQNRSHDNVIIAIMDADSYVDADYFTHALTLFACNKEIQAIQSKVKIVPDTNQLFDLTHMQDLEFSVILNFMQGLRAKNANAALGGNGQFTRLSALDIVIDEGPWTNSLVEDFDLSTRFTLHNVKKVVHIVDLVVFQSGVTNIRKLLRQRTRWAQGNMQCNKFIPEIVKSKYISLTGKFELVYFLTKPWLVILEFFIITVVLFELLIFGFSESSLFPFWVNILLVMALFIINFFWSLYYLIDKEIQMLQKSKPFNALITLINSFFLSFFMMILNFSYLRAFFRFLLKKNDWEKTERTLQ